MSLQGSSGSRSQGVLMLMPPGRASPKDVGIPNIHPVPCGESKLQLCYGSVLTDIHPQTDWPKRECPRSFDLEGRGWDKKKRDVYRTLCPCYDNRMDRMADSLTLPEKTDRHWYYLMSLRTSVTECIIKKQTQQTNEIAKEKNNSQLKHKLWLHNSLLIHMT